MDPARIIGFAILAFVAWTIFSASTQPAPTIAGKATIPMDTSALHWGWKKDTDGEQTMDLRSRSTNDLLSSYVADAGGLWHQTGEQAEHGVVVARIHPDLYLGKWNFDVGPIAGVADLPKRNAQLGIRYSPIRLGFDTLALDAVATNDAIGAGFSLYPPERSVGPLWSHIGIGAWYLVPWDGSAPGPMLGITASFNH